MDDSDSYGEGDGDHSPDISGPGVPGGMPRSRAYDGAFLVIALVIAAALLAVIFYIKA